MLLIKHGSEEKFLQTLIFANYNSFTKKFPFYSIRKNPEYPLNYNSISTTEQQLQRLMQRDGLSSEEAQQRIGAQMPLAEKCRKANFVIDNSRELRFTHQQTFTLYHTMKRMSSWCGLYRWVLVAVIGLVLYRILYQYI